MSEGRGTPGRDGGGEAPGPVRRGPGWQGILKIAFFLAPLVVGVVVLRRNPLYLVVFVVLFAAITLFLASTSLARCRHCGYLIFAGFGVPAHMIKRCPRCRKELVGRSLYRKKK
jgi:hypothetical protein